MPANLRWLVAREPERSTPRSIGPLVPEAAGGPVMTVPGAPLAIRGRTSRWTESVLPVLVSALDSTRDWRRVDRVGPTRTAPMAGGAQLPRSRLAKGECICCCTECRICQEARHKEKPHRSGSQTSMSCYRCGSPGCGLGSGVGPSGVVCDLDPGEVRFLSFHRQESQMATAIAIPGETLYRWVAAWALQANSVCAADHSSACFSANSFAIPYRS